METKVESMVTVPIHQASSSVPSLSTPVIDITTLKPVSPPIQEPIFAATTAATSTTLLLPPPPQQQSTTEPSLASRVLTMEQRCANLKKQCKLQDKMTQSLSSKIFTLELRDLPHKIDETVYEAVKEASGTYKSLTEHVALYEALDASMKRANRDEFLAEKDKSQKKRRDDQDPPPPPPDSDLSKKKRHDSSTSGSKQPPAPQSSAWKTSNTREAPSSSSKQKSVPHSKQLNEDVPIPDDMNISNSEDTNVAHLPKIKTRPDWLKPVLEEDRPSSPEPDWFQMEECHLLLTDQVDLVNPEGHRVVPDVCKPLPLVGPPVRSHMRILSVVSLKTYERYGYTFLKEIVLPRADYKEYKILEADFKNLYLNDFEDMDLLRLQGHLNHLSGANKVHFFNAVNLKKMMRETEVHKFSDGTLNRILDKLDHMVKDFKLFKFNPGMETIIWSKDDKRRSKILGWIERRLKIRRIFRSLESFVGEG
ncbi:hypothetical protein Tco_0321161 [Tanacetum coccineum]